MCYKHVIDFFKKNIALNAICQYESTVKLEVLEPSLIKDWLVQPWTGTDCAFPLFKCVLM